jgi:TFIIF-interacting CTD phosphatase-like protein
MAGAFLRPAIAFDLDETLISTSLICSDPESINVRIRRRHFFVRPRPGLLTFLARISTAFDVYFFTSSAREYGNPIIDAIAPGTPGDRRFFRDSCVSFCGYPVKDLRLLNVPLSRILLVDDLEGSALLQPQNLVRVAPWQGSDPRDNVLHAQLLPALMEIADAGDLPSAFLASSRKNQYGGLFLSAVASGGSPPAF